MTFQLPFASARTRSRIIRMAADAGLDEAAQRAVADSCRTVESARAELDRRARHQAVMRIPSVDELPEADRRRAVETTQSPEAAHSAAVDMIAGRRAYEIEHGADARPPEGFNGSVPNRSVAGAGWSWDQGPGFTAKMADGLAARLNPKHTPTMGREYAGMALADMAIESLRASGAKGLEIPRERAAAVQMAMSRGGMHTSSDFSGILAGAAQTVVSEGYRTAEPEIVRASRMLTAPDFRARTMMRLSSGPQLEEVNEAGKITSGTFAEEGEPAPAVKVYAKLFHLSYQAIVNDDVSAFSEVPRKMVEGASSTVRGVLTGLLAENGGSGPTMRDGNALFDAAHNNLAGTGGALSLTTLSAAIAKMRRQTGAAGEVLAIRPMFLVVPPEQENAARSLIADISPEQVSNVNPWSDLLDVLVEPGLSDPTRWYIVADPGNADGLAHAFLDGFATPTVDQEQGFDRLGLSFRCRLHFGASFTDWRSWYANDGA